MRKNSVLIAILLLFSGILNLNAQWKVINSGTTLNLNSIYITSSNTGWIVGDGGTILQNTENTWKRVKSPTGENLYSVFFTSRYDGWAVGSKGTILRYNGSEWELCESPAKSDLRSVSFSDTDNGIAAGKNGTILTYSQGRWARAGKKVRGDLFSVASFNGSSWIAGSHEGVGVPVMRITDAKGEMTESTLGSYSSVFSMSFVKENDGYAAASPGALLHFDGNSWNKINTGYNFPSLTSVYFKDDKGIAAGYEGTVLIYSENTWKKESSITGQKLNGTFINDNVFYTVGDCGTILVSDRSAAEKQEVESGTETGLTLYPNPCSDLLNISLPDGTYGNLRISITNPNGQLIMSTVANGADYVMPVKLATGDLKEGLYILSIATGETTISQRFMVRR